MTDSAACVDRRAAFFLRASEEAWRQRIDGITVEVVSHLHDHGVHAILLKGPAVSSWLYGGDSSRTYVDTDLLVSPEDLAEAEDCLSRLGFSRVLGDEDVPSTLSHEAQWIRLADGAILDLHQSLAGAGVSPARLWETLSSSPDILRVQGIETMILSEPGRALHVGLHAAQHGPGAGKPLDDLARALGLADRRTWLEAATLADRIDATAAFSAGLRLLPAGASLADELELPTMLPVDIALLAGGAPPEALTVESLARAPGMRTKLRMVGRKMVPTRGYMRAWYPKATRRRRGMAMAYLYRPFWLLSKASPAWRAWRRARAAQTR